MDLGVRLDPHVRIGPSIEQRLNEVQHAIGVRARDGSGFLISILHREIERRPAFGVGKIDVCTVVHQIKRHIVVTVLHGD